MTIRIASIARLLLALLAALALAACGASKPATLDDIPAYPGATVLQPGESRLADTLAQNNQTDAALRGQLGVGGKTEQRGYSLPADVSWPQVKGFYDERLKAGGWTTNSMVSSIMEQANQGNELFQTANWQKGSQNVTVVMMTSPMDPAVKELIVSLASQ
ncbi:MAG TPA: hypothetical protein VNL77_16410 [Roseiflexaceae bacterium]|nr:hypothetical protein [Roseiflexaceae bacterium]